MLKFSQDFKIILYSFADWWFIIQFAFHDLITITQLQNILIYFIRTATFQKIFYVLIVTKKKSYIIEDAIAISCNLTFSSWSIETKYIFLLETQKKIMKQMLCLTRSTRTSKLIKMINFCNDEYEFLNVRQWRITFSFLIDNEYFNIFDLDEFINVLLFPFFDMFFSLSSIILYISDLLNILNLIFYFLDCAIYHIWFENRFKSIVFFFVFKK